MPVSVDLFGCAFDRPHVPATKGGAMKLLASTMSMLVPTLPRQLEMAGVSRSLVAGTHSPASSSRLGTCAHAPGGPEPSTAIASPAAAHAAPMHRRPLGIALFCVVGGIGGSKSGQWVCGSPHARVVCQNTSSHYTKLVQQQRQGHLGAARASDRGRKRAAAPPQRL